MGLAHLLLHLNASRPFYKLPADVGTPCDRPDDNEEPEWDVVIVGGGTAGCVLASRLSERADLRILLLEAGQSGTALAVSRLPLGYSLLWHSKHDWNLYTTPQPHAANRRWFWPRGRLLGGCSSINSMIFHNGCPEDFSHWVPSDSLHEPGASQWSYEAFSPYFRKFEGFTPNPRFPVEGERHRGRYGPIKTGFDSHHGAWASAFVDSCERLGVPVKDDLNTPKGSLGVAHVMTYVGPNGERSTAESAYLTEDVLRRPNLTVVTGAHVTRILFSSDGGTIRASGVEFTDGRHDGARKYRVKARKEVVLSAGAVHSPQILLLSGIGPSSQLSHHSIPCILDLPGVGQGLKDHPIVDTMWRMRSAGLRGASLEWTKPDTGIWGALRTLVATGWWMISGRGVMGSNVTESAAFLRSDDPHLFPSGLHAPREDSSSGPNAPDLEIICCPFAIRAHGAAEVSPGGEVGSMAAVLLRPTSSGSITLASNNAFDDPIIDPNYFATQHDIDVLVRGMRAMFAIAKEAPLRYFIDHDTKKDKLFDHKSDLMSDEGLEDVVRERAQTLYHPTSTLRMAPLSDGGCVDYFLRMHGVPNLRVVDCSILPEILSGHTAGVALALGEKAADLIKDAYEVDEILLP